MPGAVSAPLHGTLLPYGAIRNASEDSSEKGLMRSQSLPSANLWSVSHVTISRAIRQYRV